MPATQPTSSASTTHKDSPPLFLEERDVTHMRSLQDLYEITKSLNNLTLFYQDLYNYKLVIFQEVIQDEKWRKIMNEEIKVIVTNDTWELAIIPRDHKVIDIKLVYKMKKNAKSEIKKYKVRLLAKGYNQKADLTMMKYLLLLPN